MVAEATRKPEAAAQPPARNIAISKLKLTNLLSFKEAELELRPLNILIGANASGKSNLLDAVGLLQAAAQGRLEQTIFARNGNVSDWLWTGSDVNPVAKIEVEIPYPSNEEDDPSSAFRYWLSFKSGMKQELLITDEHLEDVETNEYQSPFDYLTFKDDLLFGDVGLLHVTAKLESGQIRQYATNRSAPSTAEISKEWPRDNYSQLFHVSKLFRSLRLYREWWMGRDSPVRALQQVGVGVGATELDESISNLAAVYNNLSGNRQFRAQVRKYLKEFREGNTDVRVRVLGGQFLQLMLEEDGHLIPATRLSDGTLHWLALMAVLLPVPPPDAPPRLICLEEPETGLHPDVIIGLSDMLKEASKHSQIIVTTHSRQLVDRFTRTPEDVVVFEKDDEGTYMERLSKEELGGWLEDYSLGQAWARNAFGGNRF